MFDRQTIKKIENNAAYLPPGSLYRVNGPGGFCFSEKLPAACYIRPVSNVLFDVEAVCFDENRKIND